MLERDGGRAGEDRGPGAVQGEGHRLVPVLVAAQLLAVAGDEQQRVVRAGAEDEHGEDARALRVDHQAGVPGQQVDHAWAVNRAATTESTGSEQQA